MFKCTLQAILSELTDKPRPLPSSLMGFYFFSLGSLAHFLEHGLPPYLPQSYGNRLKIV